RLPYALFGPNIVTHIPLYRTSREDAIFKRHTEQFSEFLDGNFETYFSEVRPDAIKKDEYLEDGHLSAATIDKTVAEIWLASREALRTTKRDHPELFAFYATTLIDLEINRITHNHVVHLMHARLPPWDDLDLRKHAYNLTNAILCLFLDKVHECLDK